MPILTTSRWRLIACAAVLAALASCESLPESPPVTARDPGQAVNAPPAKNEPPPAIESANAPVIPAASESQTPLVLKPTPDTPAPGTTMTPGDTAKPTVEAGTAGPAPETPSGEGVKPVEPPPVSVQPPAAAGMTQFPTLDSPDWAELVKNTSVEQMLALLKAKAEAGDDPAARMAAAGGLLGHAASGGAIPASVASLEAADKLLQALMIRPEISNTCSLWLDSAMAMVDSLSGSPARAFAKFRDAVRKAASDVPPEIGEIWFMTPDLKKDETGFWTKRKTASGVLDDVYRPTDVIYVAQKFRFLRGPEIEGSGKYYRNIEISASLTDEKGQDVPNFKFEPKRLDYRDGIAPDLYDCAWQKIPLPHGIKSELDYTLKITIRDISDPKATDRVTSKEITVRVRTR